LTKAVEMTPSANAYSNLGSVYLSLRQFEQASTAFEKAYASNPRSIRACGNLARAYYWTPGRCDEARKLLEQAIRLGQEALAVNPTDAGADILLAYYHAMLGRKTEALAHLGKALRAEPNNGEFLFWAGVVHNRFGDRVTALASLEQAAALGYSRSEIQTTPELEDLGSDSRFQSLIRAK